MYDTVVAISGVARSGASWFGEILDSSPSVAYRFQPLFSYAFKGAVNEDSTRADFEDFFRGIYASTDDFLLQRDKRDAGLYPTFAKDANLSCLVWKEARYQYALGSMLRFCEQVKLLALVRHPCAVINSWLRNPKEFPPGSDPRTEWRFGSCKNLGAQENFFGFYKWKEAAHMYLDLREQHPNRVKVLRYVDLVDDTQTVVQGVFDFVGLPVAVQTRQFLDASHATHQENPYAVFKSKSVKDTWRSQLPQYISDSIVKDLQGTRLEQFLE